MGDMVLDIVVIVGSHIEIEVVVFGGYGMGPVVVFACFLLFGKFTSKNTFKCGLLVNSNPYVI